MTCCASISPITFCCALPIVDAATGLLDIARLGDMLKRVLRADRLAKRLDRVSPLAVPALLEIGREMVAGEAGEDILREAKARADRGRDAGGVKVEGE